MSILTRARLAELKVIFRPLDAEEKPKDRSDQARFTPFAVELLDGLRSYGSSRDWSGWMEAQKKRVGSADGFDTICAVLPDASLEDVRLAVLALFRSERFSEGTLFAAQKHGVFLNICERLETLLYGEEATT